MLLRCQNIQANYILTMKKQDPDNSYEASYNVWWPSITKYNQDLFSDSDYISRNTDLDKVIQTFPLGLR